MAPRTPAPRPLDVPAVAAGLRLDRFLARWFGDYSRSALAAGVRAGLVSDPDGVPYRPAKILRGGEQLRIWIPGLAPSTPPPPFPPILHEDDRIVVIDKPAGLITHPAGNDFTWAVVTLAKQRWPDADLVHRIDRDTSGVLVLAKDADANRKLKAVMHDGGVEKAYEALCRGLVGPDTLVCDGPIGAADGPIRIQMAVRPDGQAAHTEVTVLERRPGPTGGMTRVRCRITTGRTHQIRVHLAHAGNALVGDRLYGVPPDVFLDAWEHGVSRATIAAAGAPRHALHAARVEIPHPDGGVLVVEAPFPDDLQRWWDRPDVLPFDGHDDVVGTIEDETAPVSHGPARPG